MRLVRARSSGGIARIALLAVTLVLSAGTAAGQAAGNAAQNAAATPGSGAATRLADAPGAGTARLVQDQTIALAPAGDDPRCAQLLGSSGGWCSRIRFEVQRPSALTGQVVRIWVDPPQRTGKSGPTATDRAAFGLQASPECKPQGGGSAIAITFPDGGSCSVRLTAAASAAGEYQANLRVRDPSGALDQSAALTVRSAEGPLSLLLYLAFGALLGALIAYLRTVFAPRATGLAEALRQAQRFEMTAAIAEQSRLVPKDGLAPLAGEARNIVADARSGRGEAEARTAFAARVSALGIWASLAHQARALEAAGLQPLRKAFNQAFFEIVSGSDPAASLPALRTAVADAVSEQASSESVDAADAATAAEGPVTVPDFSRLVLGGITRIEQLDRRWMEMSLVETAATFALFAVAAILMLWVGNDSWGTVADKLNAILVGAGAFLGSAAIRTIRDGAVA